jgi:hypothetical protein
MEYIKEYIKEYKKILKKTDFVVKLKDFKLKDFELKDLELKDQKGDIIYIYIIDRYDKLYGDDYQLVVKINDTTKTIIIYENLDMDAQINYKIDQDEYELYKKIILKTIELGKKNLKEIIISDNLHVLERDFLKEIGFKYLYDAYLEKKKTKSISLKLIQMIIVKNVNIDYNKISKLNEDKKRIMNILKEVKIIYKSNKELIDFKKEMVKASYWEIIEKEIYIILGIDHLDLTPENLRTLTMKLNL